MYMYVYNYVSMCTCMYMYPANTISKCYIDLLTSLQDGYTAIVVAALNGRTEVVKVLVQKNADINSQTKVHYRYVHV